MFCKQGLSQIRNLQRAQRFASNDSLLQAGSNPSTYVELMRLKAEKSFQEEGKKEALKRSETLPKSPESFKNNLRGLLRLGLLQEAQEYFFRVKNQTTGIVSEGSYQLLLKGYANNDEPFLADKIFSHLKNEVTTPSAESYATLIRAFVNANFPEEALALFQQMQSKNLSSESAARSVATGLFQARRPAEAETYLALIQEKTLDDYLIAARGYALMKDSQKVDNVLNKLRLDAEISKSTSFLLSKLVSELSTQNLQQQLVSVLRNIVNFQISISWETWKQLDLFSADKRNILSDSAEATALWEEICSLVQRTNHSNPPPSVQFANIQNAIEQHNEIKIIRPSVLKGKSSFRADNTATLDVDDHWNKLIQQYFKEYQNQLEEDKHNIKAKQSSRQQQITKSLNRTELRKLRLKEKKMARGIASLAES